MVSKGLISSVIPGRRSAANPESRPTPTAVIPAQAGIQYAAASRLELQPPAPSLRAKRSNPCRRAKEDGLLRFARNDGRKTHLRIPAARFARALRIVSPKEKRAQGTPGACCTRGLACKNAHRKRTRAYRHSRSIPASLRNGFTAYAVLSPATNSSCHRHRRINGFVAPGRANKNLRRLDTSNGCRNHTVLPYASAPFVCHAGCSLTGRSPPCDPVRARRCRVHRISPRRV
jgi:hypothetical protein